jgi:site-specific recombinase XerD
MCDISLLTSHLSYYGCAFPSCSDASFLVRIRTVTLLFLREFYYLYRTEEEKRMVLTRDAVDGFIASLRARRAPANTVKAYAHDLRHFVAAVPPSLSDVSVPLIEQFLAGDGHLSPATQARRYATLCTFYRWTLLQELMPSNPMERLDPITQPKKEPRPLAREEVVKILKAIPASNLRDRALFTLLYETGIRVGEALALHTAILPLPRTTRRYACSAKGSGNIR